jgi:poly-gamma-glutamate synthesis protein (capsule biosynthesis protein)
VVVLAVHWSRDFEPRARGNERALARRFVERGADVILGTGPHVLHAVERLPSPRGEAVVAYSLGNVVSGMGRSYRSGRSIPSSIHPANIVPEARDGVVLQVEIVVANSMLRIVRIEGVPLWTENTWLAHEARGEPHRVFARRLSECEPSVRAERLPIVTRALGPEVSLH